MKIKECMCCNPICATPNQTVSDCAKIMNEKHIGCLPICNNNMNVVGFVTDRDIVLRTVACNKDSNSIPISEIMTCDVKCCNCNEDISQAQKVMVENNIRRIPVVDNGKIVGMLTLGNLTLNEKINSEELKQTFKNICNSKKNAE